MRKMIAGCGIAAMALVFAVSTASAAPKKRPVKRGAPVVKVPAPSAPQGFCIPPGNRC